MIILSSKLAQKEFISRNDSDERIINCLIEFRVFLKYNTTEINNALNFGTCIAIFKRGS